MRTERCKTACSRQQTQSCLHSSHADVKPNMHVETLKATSTYVRQLRISAPCTSGSPREREPRDSATRSSQHPRLSDREPERRRRQQRHVVCMQAGRVSSLNTGWLQCGPLDKMKTEKLLCDGGTGTKAETLRKRQYRDPDSIKVVLQC